jgi:hypothetical protein
MRFSLQEKIMFRTKTGYATIAAFAVALGVVTAPAQALTCYTIFDRNDNVVYRDTFPPVDLSDQGTAGRAQLQQRGEYLMISDLDRCPQVAFVFGSNGTADLSTDEFLNGIRPTGATRSGVPASSATRTTPAAPAAARRPAPGAAK